MEDLKRTLKPWPNKVSLNQKFKEASHGRSIGLTLCQNVDIRKPSGSCLKGKLLRSEKQISPGYIDKILMKI